MIQLRLLLLGAALIGGIGMAVYRHLKSREQQQQHSYGDPSPRDSSNNGSGSRSGVSISGFRRRARQGAGAPQICSICLTDVFTENRLLECGHDFHKRCIDLWLNSENKVCPNCRAPAL